MDNHFMADLACRSLRPVVDGLAARADGVDQLTELRRELMLWRGMLAQQPPIDARLHEVKVVVLSAMLAQVTERLKQSPAGPGTHAG